MTHDGKIRFIDGDGHVRVDVQDRRYLDRDDRIAALVRTLFRDARGRNR